MAWWREARFGLFVHWGLYSIPAGEWRGKRIDGIGEWIMHSARIPVEEYKALAPRFNPVKFDADRWVSLAKEAGMKYVVFTSKHHDGFAMYRSRVSNFNIYDATPFKRDPVAELAEACRKHDIKLGLYYSQAQDWTHPGGAAYKGHWDPAQDGSMDDYIRDIAAPQVREILTNYGPISIIWWDTPHEMTKERADMILPLLDLQPGIIANNRLGHYEGDFSTPEQYIPPTGLDRDWEACMTMNDTWGYKSYDDNWKSSETLIRNLIDIVSKGGNYLLNVGPTSLGEIPTPSVDRLREIGRWMSVNGEAIHGTGPSPFSSLDFEGRCTVKGNRLYAHVFEWPAQGIRLSGLRNHVQSAEFLAGGKADYSVNEGMVTIERPADPDPVATVVALTLDGRPRVEA